MEYKKTIPLALLVLALSFMLLFADNIEPASAILVRINPDIDTVTSLISYGNYSLGDVFFYSKPLGADGDITFVNGDTLDIEADVDMGATNEMLGFNAMVFACSNSLGICAFPVAPITNLRLAVFDMSDFSFSVYVESNATRASCRLQTLANTNSGTAYGTVAGCTDSTLDGIWQINFGLIGQSGITTSEVFVQRVSLPNAVDGVFGACYDSTTGKAVFAASNNGVVRVFTPSTDDVSTVDVGTDADDVICNSGSAITFADGDDEVNVISLSSVTVTATTSVTNPKTGMVHVDNLFVSRTDSTSLTLFDYSTTALTSIGTLTGFNLSTLLVQGNATRINAMGTTTNLLDAYAIDDLEDDGSATPSPNEEFCSIPANRNLLTCRLEETGNTGLSGTSQLINQSSTNIMCQTGLIACTQGEDGNFIPDNPNIQTNGVGYLMVAIALGVFVGIMWIASRGAMTDIPTFVWFIGTLAIVGSITAIGWIDPTFLVITVIAIVAMAVAKAKGVFGERGQLFAGEAN